jgi:hypothetical protein
MRLTIYIPAGLVTAARNKAKAVYDPEGGERTFSAECVPAPGPGTNVTHHMANFEVASRPVLRRMNAEYSNDIKGGLEGEFPGAKVYIDTPIEESLDDMGLKIKVTDV